MPSINTAFPSNFLKVDDLQGRNVTVTIGSAKIEEIGQGRDKDTKIMIGMVGKTKKFVCNKTNAKVIASLYGDDTDGWIGKQIILAPREVQFGTDMVWAIRVSLTKPAAPTGHLPPPVAPAPRPAPAPASSDQDPEDVPF